MKKLFGTDGMRGEAGRFPLDAATLRVVGGALARHLAERTEGRAPRIVTGRDTRESGAWIEEALVAGAREAGAAVESAGVITTPGVAYLARTLPADAGVVISASHNPYQDNGIKIFAPSGRKMDDATERQIEAEIAAAQSDEDHQSEEKAEAVESREMLMEDSKSFVESHETAHALELQGRYLDYLTNEVAGDLSLEGLSIAMDCANGAASRLAPALLKRLGAHVIAINDEPDGRNINLDCGSLHIGGLQKAVAENAADLGVAFDGDADRALFVDGRGRFVDGDATLWVMAKHLDARSLLKDKLVVSTVMSNIGLEIALRERGMSLRRTDVGDKYVLEELLKTGASIGGEQSGHIIFPRQSLAGDGMMTTLLMLRAMIDERKPLHELTAGLEHYPQVLVNVRVREKRPFAEVPLIQEAAREVEAKLGEQGRLLLRYSGTEPLARVMIEGARQDEIERLAQELAGTIKSALGDS